MHSYVFCHGHFVASDSKMMSSDHSYIIKRQTGYEHIPRSLLGSCAMKWNFDDILLIGTNISSLAAMLDPCPCTQLEALHDERFVPQVDKFQCFVSAFPLEVNVVTSRINLTQQCCYDINRYI